VQVSLSTNVCCIELEDTLDLKIFVNASAGHRKHCSGPHLARGPLIANPWSRGLGMCVSLNPLVYTIITD